MTRFLCKTHESTSSNILLELERPSLGRKFVVSREACGSRLVKLDTPNLELSISCMVYITGARGY